MATAKLKAQWNQTSQVLWLLWHGHQPESRKLESFNPFTEKPQTGRTLGPKESMEYLQRNLPFQ